MNMVFAYPPHILYADLVRATEQIIVTQAADSSMPPR